MVTSAAVRGLRRAASVLSIGESGGYCGEVSTMALVPQVVDAVSPIPVVASGGIFDGRGIAAALTLGDLARKSPRVIVYTGVSKLETRIDQIGQLGYAVGFQRLVGFVMQQLPQNEVIESALRREVKLLPENSVRELLANALIHQDLKVSGSGPVIEIYQDRMEVSNPGEPIVMIDRFIDGYQSRNERLADFMRRMKICEERGSGIDRVVHEAEFFQLPAPKFQSSLIRTMATVYGPQPFEEMDREDRIRACRGRRGFDTIAVS
jgi:ATP-dependent DNA helicase RecG